jgi:hypothetical protein
VLKARNAALLLGALGLLRMIADLAGLAPLAAAAAATGASPAPRVFSSVRGLETYSTRFFVEWTTDAGAQRSVELTPERYARLAGPYNRRNVYGAAIAYGPLLAGDPHAGALWRSVYREALCGDAPLLGELGIDASDRIGNVRVRVQPKQRPADADWPTLLEEDCE